MLEALTYEIHDSSIYMPKNYDDDDDDYDCILDLDNSSKRFWMIRLVKNQWMISNLMLNLVIKHSKYLAIYLGPKIKGVRVW